MNEPKFPPEYFYDEVREGFYVSEMMKRFWAAQMVVLYEIVKVCERHDITWYADMGTLLGAIRHKGYVPWDDDLDISMNRDDWELFFKYAKAELPEGYCVLSQRTEEEYTLSIGRITNSRGINTMREHMERYYGCPYVVGVDVYPIDKMYKDPVKEQDRIRRAKAIRDVINLINAQGLDAEESRKALAAIERENHTVLHRNKNIGKELTLLFEQICMECRDEDYDQVALMNTWLLYDWANCPRRTYEERMEIPFENNVLMGTVNYDELLTIYYHDYMTIKRGGGAHDYPIYKSQEKLYREKVGHNLLRYTFRPEELHLQRVEGSFGEKCSEILGLMKKSADLCVRLIPDDGAIDENVFNVLSGCQELAIHLGTLVEDKYGEDCAVVRRVEDYCEKLYLATQQWSDEIAKGLAESLAGIEKGIAELLNITKKTAVFLPCRSAWWDTMKPLYDAMSQKGDVVVRVMPVSFYDKDPYGNTGDCHDESDYFSQFAGYTDPESYDIRKKHPETIIMQVPFDGAGNAFAVPPAYYSAELLKCCDELWYVPCFDPLPPQSQDDKALAAIPVLVEQPAVVNADRVIIDNAALREFYIGKLTEMSGEDTVDYWKNKCRAIKDVVCNPS